MDIEPITQCVNDWLTETGLRVVARLRIGRVMSRIEYSLVIDHCVQVIDSIVKFSSAACLCRVVMTDRTQVVLHIQAFYRKINNAIVFVSNLAPFESLELDHQYFGQRAQSDLFGRFWPSTFSPFQFLLFSFVLFCPLFSPYVLSFVNGLLLALWARPARITILNNFKHGTRLGQQKPRSWVLTWESRHGETFYKNWPVREVTPWTLP